MGPLIVLLCLGCALPAVGALLMIMAIPFTSWSASWVEFKSAFHVMLHNRKFQVGIICIVIGIFIILYIFQKISP